MWLSPCPRRATIRLASPVLSGATGTFLLGAVKTIACATFSARDVPTAR